MRQATNIVPFRRESGVIPVRTCSVCEGRGLVRTISGRRLVTEMACKTCHGTGCIKTLRPK